MIGFVLGEETDVAGGGVVEDGCEGGGGGEVSLRIVEVCIVVGYPASRVGNVSCEGLLCEELAGEFRNVRGDGGAVVSEDVLEVEDGR